MWKLRLTPSRPRPGMISIGSSAHLFFQLVARRYERSSLLLTTNQVVAQWAA
jgi:DNA replication protein DnaC